MVVVSRSLRRLASLPSRWAAATYFLLDGLCVGIGMGVPLFNILLGFAVGAFIAVRETHSDVSLPTAMRRILRQSVITSALTLLFMLIIWLPWTRVLFDPAQDVSQVGIPLILYEPMASFVGWQVLMIAISPFLQLLTTVFAAFLVLATLVSDGQE